MSDQNLNIDNLISMHCQRGAEVSSASTGIKSPFDLHTHRSLSPLSYQSPRLSALPKNHTSHSHESQTGTSNTSEDIYTANINCGASSLLESQRMRRASYSVTRSRSVFPTRAHTEAVVKPDLCVVCATASVRCASTHTRLPTHW